MILNIGHGVYWMGTMRFLESHPLRKKKQLAGSNLCICNFLHIRTQFTQQSCDVEHSISQQSIQSKSPLIYSFDWSFPLIEQNVDQRLHVIFSSEQEFHNEYRTIMFGVVVIRHATHSCQFLVLSVRQTFQLTPRLKRHHILISGISAACHGSVRANEHL